MRVVVHNTYERPARYREGRIVDRSWGRERGIPIYRFTVRLDEVEGRFVFERGQLAHPDPSLRADEVAFFLGSEPVTFTAVRSFALFMKAVTFHFADRFANEDENELVLGHAVGRVLRTFAAWQRLEVADGRQEIDGLVCFTTDQGWDAEIPTDAPPEALAQLIALHGTSWPNLDQTPAPRLRWHESVWRLSGSRDGHTAAHSWGPAGWE